MRNNNKSITGLIISAGLSQRMGKFKPLLNFNGKTFLRNIAEKLSEVCNKIVIVSGHNAKLIEEHINDWEENLQKKIQLVYNANYERGMFTSLKLGVEHCRTNWLLYHFVDQPNLSKNFYTEFVEKISAEYDWIQPVFNNRKGHPILFNKNVVGFVGKLERTSSLKYISSSAEIKKKYWECNYPEINLDIDTIDDYNKLTT
jgi:molybdenum cofactor cytidylyltransferase